MEKKCKIVLLPTDKPTKIHRNNLMNLYYTPNKSSSVVSDDFQLFVLSDDEIKERDWYYQEFDGKEIGLAGKEEVKEKHLFKKVIATTNPDLIKEGVASIDDDFIKSYCDNPVEEVLVEYENLQKTINYHKDLWVDDWKPKLPSNGSISIKPVKKDENTWFNEYQKVEDYIIKLLGEEFIKLKLVDGYESDRTIQMIDELVKPVEETWDTIAETYQKSQEYEAGTFWLFMSENYEVPKKR